MFSALSAASVFGQDAGKSAAGPKYIAAKNFSSASSIPLTDVNEFVTLIKDLSVQHIFYTDNLFYFQAPSMTIPYTISSNGYKNLDDYQSGSGKYTNGASFYYAKENQLTSQAEVDYYRQEKFLRPKNFRDAQAAGFYNKKSSGKRITRISGLLTRKELQTLLPYANAIIYLMYLQQSDPTKGFLDNTDVDKFMVQFSVSNS